MLGNSVGKNALTKSSIEYEESTKEAILGTLQETLLGTLLGPHLSPLWDPGSLRTWGIARPNEHSVLAGERCMPMQRWDADPFLAANQEAMAVLKGRLRRRSGR